MNEPNLDTPSFLVQTLHYNLKLHQYTKTPDSESNKDIEIYDWVVNDNFDFKNFLLTVSDKLSKIDKGLAP